MLADRFGLSLSTSSAAARDAYVDASERALTFYPGALPAYDSAIAAEPGFALAHAGKAQVLMREGNVPGARGPGGGKGIGCGRLRTRGEPYRNFRSGFDRTDRGGNRRRPQPSGGVAVRRAGDFDCGQPERLDRRLRPSRAKAPDRRADGQPSTAFRRRLLVPVLPCDGAFGRWTARGGTAEDRAIGGAEPEERAWRARVCPRLLRRRRTRHRAPFCCRGSPRIRATDFSTVI
jgi:hypothetical protein